jgi:hypothetical protein
VESLLLLSVVETPPLLPPLLPPPGATMLQTLS